MKRLNRRELCSALHKGEARVRELCRSGYFLSAKQDQPRHGWSVAECCVRAELNTEWPCGVCSGEEEAAHATPAS